MKLKDLLKSRVKLKAYDMLVKELIQVHTSHVDSCETDRLDGIGEILTFEERRAANHQQASQPQISQQETCKAYMEEVDEALWYTSR